MSHTRSHLSVLHYLFNLISIRFSVDGRSWFKHSSVRMSLGLWGRFLVLVAGASVVVLAVAVVACFVGPGCWGFEFLRREEKRKKGQSGGKTRSKTVYDNRRLGPYHWLDNNDYVIYETGPRGLEAKIPRVEETPQYLSKDRVFNLKCAPLLVAPNLYSAAKDSAPKLAFKLQYSELGGEEGLVARLAVHVISARSLPCREYVPTLDPFVAVEILNNKWSLQKNDRIVHAAQTLVAKNTTSPTFDQTFAFECKRADVKNWCLKLRVLDEDRLTRVSPLFERRVHLKEVRNLTTEDHVSFDVDMHEVVESTGALLFGVSYLPTAQRLNISVMKASHLKYRSCVRSLVDFYPYVRVVMVNNRGKCIKKKKTHFRHGNENPVFNQSLIFDLSISNLEQTVFLVLLCTRAPCQLFNSDDSSPEGDVEASLKESRDKVLGAIALGRNVRCTRARDHWVTVMQNPRKMISVWHDLR